MCLLFFSRFYKYGIILAKNRIPQIRVGHTPPASRIISVFSHKYGNGPKSSPRLSSSRLYYSRLLSPAITPFGCTILGCSRLRLFQPKQQSEADGDRVCYFWAVAQPNKCVGQPNGCCAQAEAAQQPRAAKSSTAEQSEYIQFSKGVQHSFHLMFCNFIYGDAFL